MTYISWTEEMTKRFTKAYNKARKEGLRQFTFEGNEFVIDYAYYLIQYLVMGKLISGSFNDDKVFTIDNHILN